MERQTLRLSPETPMEISAAVLSTAFFRQLAELPFQAAAFAENMTEGSLRAARIDYSWRSITDDPNDPATLHTEHYFTEVNTLDGAKGFVKKAEALSQRLIGSAVISPLEAVRAVEDLHALFADAAGYIERTPEHLHWSFPLNTNPDDRAARVKEVPLEGARRFLGKLFADSGRVVESVDIVLQAPPPDATHHGQRAKIERAASDRPLPGIDAVTFMNLPPAGLAL